MKRKDLLTKLKKAGWQISHGSNHDLARHPNKQSIKLTIPRHNEIDEYTAKAILRDAGLL